MAFIDTPNGIRAVMNYLCEGQQCANVFHVQAADSGDGTTLQDVAQRFADWWTGNVKAKQHTACELLNVTATDISTSGGAQRIYTTGLPASGTNGSDSLTNSITVTTTLTTGFTGRSFRGRFYWIGLTPDDLLDVNHITTSAAAALTAAGEALIALLAGHSTPLCVLSLQLNNIPRTSGVLTPVTGCHTDNTIDSQRRRLPGRGL